MFFEKTTKIRNPSYTTDIVYVINKCRALALIIGLWPTYQHDSISKKTLKIFLHIFYYFATLFTLVFSTLHGIFELHDLHSRLVVFGPIIFWIMLLLKYTFLWSRNATIKKCMTMIEQDWQNVESKEHRAVMMKRAKFGNCIIIICASFMLLGGFFYHVIIPITAEPISTIKNLTVQPFSAPVYGNYLSSGSSPIYEIVFTVQLFSGFMNDTLNVMTFSLAAVLILHSCGQFDLVIALLNNFVSDDNKNLDLSHNRLVIIVKHHFRIMSFITHLEDLLNEICLIEVTGSTIIICLLGYYIIVAFKETEVSDILTYTLLISSFIFNVFIYSYIGDLLTRQAVKVGDFACTINWYDLPKQTAKELIFFIKMTQYPVKITAGKFSALSLNSFCTVLKTSAAYFNFVWRMTQ